MYVHVHIRTYIHIHVHVHIMIHTYIHTSYVHTHIHLNCSVSFLASRTLLRVVFASEAARKSVSNERVSSCVLPNNTLCGGGTHVICTPVGGGHVTPLTIPCGWVGTPNNTLWVGVDP